MLYYFLFLKEITRKAVLSLTQMCLRPWILSLVVGEQLPNRSVSQGLHQENSVLGAVMSYTQAMGALVACVIKV